MIPNVKITIRERGKITQRREVHNTFTEFGRSYLAEQISLFSIGPDSPEIDARIKYIGFGIGGVGQNQLTMVSTPPWSTVFEISQDPNHTDGNEYNDKLPVSPLIASLERPVPITAVTGPLPAYSAALNWRTAKFDPTQPYQPTSHPGTTGGGSSIPSQDGAAANRFFAQFRQGVGGTYYYIHQPWVPGGFVQMPLSEAALYLNNVTTTVAYEPAVAYVTFETVQITKDTDLEIEWDIRF